LDFNKGILIHNLVAGQPEFESRDCHPQMKSRMTSIIQRDNYFCRKKAIMDSFLGKEFLNFMATSWTKAENVHLVSYNYVIRTQVSASSGSLELAVSVISFLVQGSLSFLYRITITRRNNRQDPSSQVLFPITGLSFGLCWQPVLF